MDYRSISRSNGFRQVLTRDATRVLTGNLQRLMTEKRLYQAEVASIAKVDKASMGQWLHGNVKPTVQSLIRMAEATGIPVEAWVAGRPDFDGTVFDMPRPISRKERLKHIPGNLRYVCWLHGYSVSDLKSLCGGCCIYPWLWGERLPSDSSLYELSKRLTDWTYGSLYDDQVSGGPEETRERFILSDNLEFYKRAACIKEAVFLSEIGLSAKRYRAIGKHGMYPPEALDRICKMLGFSSKSELGKRWLWQEAGYTAPWIKREEKEALQR